eukprot:6347082-Amphidinium_carterae.1
MRADAVHAPKASKIFLPDSRITHFPFRGSMFSSRLFQIFCMNTTVTLRLTETHHDMATACLVLLAKSMRVLCASGSQDWLLGIKHLLSLQ